MSCYISSNNERVYVALESAYGIVPAITSANRIPLLKLTAKQVPEQTSRKDKTGTPDFCRAAEYDSEDHEFRSRHFDDGVDRSDSAAGVWSAVSVRDGRDAGVF